jgi:flagellar protein FlaJ
MASPFEDPSQRSIVISVILNILIFSIVLWRAEFDIMSVAPTVPVILFFGSAPYLLFQYQKYQRLKKIEEALPGFLRDITESHRSGISLPQAIIGRSRTDYGELSPEVKIMSAQLSWGIPFPDVLENFSLKMKGSAYIQRSMAIIMEAYRSGGDISEAMESVAQNARILKDLEADRSSKLSQQVMIMYVIFFIFLGMLIALHKILTPLFSLGQASELGGGFMQLSYGPSYYRTLFFHMVLIQAFFNGILAGQLGEGSVVAGLKHSAVMLGVALLVFGLFLPEVVMTVNINIPQRSLSRGTVWEVKGSATYIEGTPVANADVLITIEEMSYRTTTDEAGIINYRLPLPDLKGPNKVLVTVTDDQGRKESTEMDIIIS